MKKSENSQFIKANMHYFEMFLFHLNHGKSDGDMESLHQMRVAVKHLRALLKPFGVIDDKTASFLALLKRYFKSAGSLREIQIQLELIKKDDFQKTKKLKKHLQKKLYKKKFKFIHFCLSERRKKLVRFFFKALQSIKKIKNKKIESIRFSFYQSNVSVLSQMVNLSCFLNKRGFHEVRKLMKIVITFEDVFKLKENMTSIKWTSKRLKKIRLLLGDWHDRNSWNEELKTYKDFGNYYVWSKTQEKHLFKAIKRQFR